MLLKRRACYATMLKMVNGKEQKRRVKTKRIASAGRQAWSEIVDGLETDERDPGYVLVWDGAVVLVAQVHEILSI